MILIDAERLAASRPNRPLFADVSVTISDGDRLGVVGLNGSGKSTLLRMLAGELEPETGEVRWGRGARVGFLLQNPVLPPGTVRAAVGGEWQGEAMLDRLGMTPLLDAPTDELSGGQAKRTALARLLVGEYEVLILDEPTNHLDLDAIQFLEEWLAAYRGGLVLVTHDRHVLDKVTNKVLELDRGAAYLHVPTGWHAGSGYAAYLAGRAEREERAEVAEQVRKNLATRELAWLRRGAPARTSKPKARIATATALVEGKAQAAARDGDLVLSMGSKRLGTKGIELTDVAFAWPDGSAVLDPCSLVFEPGDRVGVVGANGAGKSTLLDLIAGRLTPTAGHGRPWRDGADRLLRPARSRPRPDPTSARSHRRRQGRAVAGRRRVDAALLVRRRRPVRADRHVERWRAPSPATAPDPGPPAQRAACSTNRPTTSISTPCGRWRTSSTTGRGSS